MPEFLEEFQLRVLQAGKRPSVAAGQMRSIRSMVKAASRQQGHAVDVLDLLGDPALLADAACDAERLDGWGDGKLTSDTLGGRRISARSCIRLMEDVLEVDADDHVRRFEAELRKRCELVGQSYLPKSGRGRRDRGAKFTPSSEDMRALLLYAARSGLAFTPERNVAFIAFLASTGLRLASAIGIDGTDFRRSGSGLTVFVREKNHDDAQEILVPPECQQSMRRYFDRRNRYATEHGSAEMIGFGLPGSIWRSPMNRRPWDQQAAAVMIRHTSSIACTQAFGPHAIRRYYTQEALEILPRRLVADAIGWSNRSVMDKHYGPLSGKSWVGTSGPSEPEGSVDARAEDIRGATAS